MLRIVAITGNQPRHRYLVEKIQRLGGLVGWILEQREPFIPDTPAGLDSKLSQLYMKHFANRKDSENRFFSPNEEISVPTIEITKNNLNSISTVKFINQLSPDLVISYGCHKLNKELIQNCTATFWNTHGGLSPDYRGVITHFWPSYNLEPQMTGMTLHQTSDQIDGGNVLHQEAANLVAGDGIHELAARAVVNYCESLSYVCKA